MDAGGLGGPGDGSGGGAEGAHARWVRALVDQLRAAYERAAGDAPHAVLQHDPETGQTVVVGPFPDGYRALAAIEVLRAAWLAQIGEPVAVYTPVLFLRPEQADGLG